jgi:hypothetical protein
MFEFFRQSFFWPGDTVIGWLHTWPSGLTAWLGMDEVRAGGLFSAFLSALIGWGLFTILCQLLLYAVQYHETLSARRRSQTFTLDQDPDQT